MSRKKMIRCNFCGKTTKQIGFVIQGTALSVETHICKNCADTCIELFQEKENLKSFSNSKLNNSKTKNKSKKVFPKNIKEYLDLHVIGQDSAKLALAIAVANHYKRIDGKNIPKFENVNIAKTNVLLIGPTGSGKTLLVKKLAEFLQVPFAIGDATCLTEAGYVGEDVESLISSLLKNCDYDVNKAQQGIIYIDEIDKIAKSRGNVSISRDVSGEGVQQSLLKLIEGSVCNVPPQGGRKHPEQKLIAVDTSNILFIVGGCFDGIDDLVRRRVGATRMGFQQINEVKSPLKYMPEDLVNFGMIPEFVGRFPLIQNLEKLNIDDLVKVIKEPTNSILNQYKKLFAIDQIELNFTDDAICEIANHAYEMETGARGISQIFEIIMFEHNFNIDKHVGKKVEIDADYVKSTLHVQRAI